MTPCSLAGTDVTQEHTTVIFRVEVAEDGGSIPLRNVRNHSRDHTVTTVMILIVLLVAAIDTEVELDMPPLTVLRSGRLLCIA
jgi:hypothetical protein